MSDMKNLYVIDFETKGNVIKLYFGDESDYWGDDWLDVPYEHNAGMVYDEYIKEEIEFAFPMNLDILTAENEWSYKGNSPFCKDDFKQRKAPCMVIVDIQDWNYRSEHVVGGYAYFIGAMNDDICKIYFGDSVEVVHEKIEKIGGKIIKERGELKINDS